MRGKAERSIARTVGQRNNKAHFFDLFNPQHTLLVTLFSHLTFTKRKTLMDLEMKLYPTAHWRTVAEEADRKFHEQLQNNESRSRCRDRFSDTLGKITDKEISGKSHLARNRKQDP